MPRVNLPLVGASSQADSTFQQSGRTINLIPVQNGTDAKAPLALENAEGYESVIDISDQFPAGIEVEMRGFHRVGHNRLFFVANERIYEAIDFAAGTVTHWASLATSTGQVGMSDNAGYLILGDNDYWTLNLNDGLGVATLQPVLNDGVDQIPGWYPRWVDGYTIYPVRNSSQFFYSEINNPTAVDGLNYATAEGDPDNINQCIVAGREVNFLGGRSREVWALTGNPDNLFERIGGGFSPYGIACRHSAAYCNGPIIFVGRHTAGEGQVVALGNAGAEAVPISTPAVEKDITGVLAESLMEQVTGFFYEARGRRFYRLNLPATAGSGNRRAQPSKTWQWDLATGIWTELAYRNPVTGLNERCKAEHHTLLLGSHYVSTYDDAAVLRMDQEIYSDVGGVPLIKYRESAGPLSMQGASFRVNKLGIEMEVGVGLDGAVQGSDPKLMMAYSWDAGKTWSNEMIRSIGKLGEYGTTVHFGPCGMGRNFVIRVSVSDPVKVVFTGAWADVVVGR